MPHPASLRLGDVGASVLEKVLFDTCDPHCFSIPKLLFIIARNHYTWIPEDFVNFKENSFQLLEA